MLATATLTILDCLVQIHPWHVVPCLSKVHSSMAQLGGVVGLQVLSKLGQLKVLVLNLPEKAKLGKVPQQAVQVLLIALGVLCQLADGWGSAIREPRGIHNAQLDCCPNSCS